MVIICDSFIPLEKKYPMRPYILVLFLTVLVSCDKKETIVITKENLKETLLKYGQDNPETQVEIKTSLGVIKLRLFDETPLHRANFIKNIKEDKQINKEKNTKTKNTNKTYRSLK